MPTIGGAGGGGGAETKSRRWTSEGFEKHMSDEGSTLCTSPRRHSDFPRETRSHRRGDHVNLQDARDHVANARKYAETDFDNEVVSALEALGTAVEAMLWKLDRVDLIEKRAERRERFLSY